MTILRLPDLLTPISPGAPSGEDLEYDAQFVAIEDAMRSEPEQQFGETIVAATEADWQTVKRLAQELLQRSKDLRVVVYLVQALTHEDGLAGLQQGLALLRAVLEQFWDSAHPQLDPDDDLDPTARVNIIASLCDATRMLRAVETAPMLQVAGLGKITLRDLRIAHGELTPREDEGETLKLDSIEAAARDVAPEVLQAVFEQVTAATADITAIEQGLTEKVGVSQAVSLSALADTLSEIDHFLRGQLAGGDDDNSGAVLDDASSTTATAAGKANAKRLSGDITSTADVTAALDKIIKYYQRNEPSSPVPLLLDRAKRLVSQDFMEILRDIAPDALPQAQVVTGAKASDAEGENY